MTSVPSTYAFQQGHHYMAGVDVPFFVSNASIREAVLERGFAAVAVLDRKALPFGDPTPHADWNTLILGVRQAPSVSEAVPHRDRVAWIWDADQPAASPPVEHPPPAAIPMPAAIPRPEAPPPEKSESEGGAGKLIARLLLGWLITKLLD